MTSELIERLRVGHVKLDIGLALHLGLKHDDLSQAATTIAALQAELAEAREVPGRIVDAINAHPEEGTEDFGPGLALAVEIIEVRDWSK